MWASAPTTSHQGRIVIVGAGVLDRPFRANSIRPYNLSPRRDTQNGSVRHAQSRLRYIPLKLYYL